MSNSSRLTALVAAALLAAACGRVKDPQAELDSDVPPGDRDATAGNGNGNGNGAEPDSGPPTDPCAYPPTPVCGEPIDEACPPGQPPELAEVFPELEPLGVLLPTPVLDDDAGYLPRLATAAAPIQGGGYGTGLILAMRRDGDVHRPVRLDLPLDDLRAARAGVLPSDGEDLADVGTVTSVAAHLAGGSDQEISLHLGDSAGEQAWRGVTDLVTLQTQITRNEVLVVDDVGSAPGLHLTRHLAGGGSVILEAFTALSGGPPFQAIAEVGVPDAPGLRMLTTTSSVAVLQDGAGTFWFWRSTADGEPVGTQSFASSDGKAAWVQGRDEYLLAHHRSGEIEFVRFDCPQNGFPDDDDPCLLAPIVNPPATISTIAPRGEAPDAVRLPDDRVAVLVTERYDEGDRLVLQVVEASLTSVTLPRIELVDLRERGERITDARVELVQTSAASTLLVTAGIGRDDAAADRVIVTGLRACAE